MENIGMGLRTTSNNRVSTGIQGFDELIQGGFPKGSITLVSGPPGTGKTIVCFQYIQAGLSKGEKCLYLTSDERITNLIKQAQLLGFDFQTPMENGQLQIMYLDVDKSDVHKDMEEAIRDGHFSRLVLDSLTPLSEVPVWIVDKGKEIIPSEGSMGTTSYPIESIQATRVHIRRILGILDKEDCTTLVTTEIPEGSRTLSRDSISEFLVDGILVLDLDTTMDRRKVTIRKMRGTKHTLKPQDIEITEGGIKLR